MVPFVPVRSSRPFERNDAQVRGSLFFPPAPDSPRTRCTRSCLCAAKEVKNIHPYSMDVHSGPEVAGHLFAPGSNDSSIPGVQYSPTLDEIKARMRNADMEFMDVRNYPGNVLAVIFFDIESCTFKIVK